MKDTIKIIASSIFGMWVAAFAISLLPLTPKAPEFWWEVPSVLSAMAFGMYAAFLFVAVLTAVENKINKWRTK